MWAFFRRGVRRVLLVGVVACGALSAVLAGAAAVLAPSAASAASIVFVKGGDVWLAAPDGSDQRQVTTGGTWSYPSQADDGTIMATQGPRLFRLNRSGDLLAPPIDTIFGGPQVGWVGPLDDAISPDGANQAYSGEIFTSPICEPICTSAPTWLTLWGSASTFSQPHQTLGQENYQTPAWIDNSHLLITSTDIFGDQVATYTIGNGDNTEVGWFSDRAVQSLNFPAITATGDKVAFVATDSAVNSDPDNEIRIYQMNGPPPEYAGDPSDLPTDVCNFPLTNFESFRLSFSPDGQSLAFEAPDGIRLLSLASWPDCTAIAATNKLIIPGGSGPYFGPANVPSSAPVPGASCKVPNLRAKTLKAAKASLTRHHCRLGRVRTKKTAGKVGRVLSQKPGPGRKLPNGSTVSVTVSRKG
jgi:hypothetical protein